MNWKKGVLASQSWDDRTHARKKNLKRISYKEDPEIMIFKKFNDYEKMCTLPSRKQVTLKGRKIEIIAIRLNATKEKGNIWRFERGKKILKPQIFYHSNSPLSKKKSILYLKYTKTSKIHCLHTLCANFTWKHKAVNWNMKKNAKKLGTWPFRLTSGISMFRITRFVCFFK